MIIYSTAISSTRQLSIVHVPNMSDPRPWEEKEEAEEDGNVVAAAALVQWEAPWKMSFEAPR